MIDELNITRVVDAAPQQCHDLVVDVESYPEWASGITDVDVRTRDADGRPLEVAYTVASFGRSASYTLAYDYSAAPQQIAWNLVAGDILSQLDGHYRFEPVDGADGPAQATAVTYRLAIELAVPLPGFVKRRAEARIAHTAVEDMQARLEAQRAVPSVA